MCCCTRQDPTCTLGVTCLHIAKPLRVVPCELHGHRFAGGSVADWNNFAREMERDNEGILRPPL
jgi:hypothetical protein